MNNALPPRADLQPYLVGLSVNKTRRAIPPFPTASWVTAEDARSRAQLCRRGSLPGRRFPSGDASSPPVRILVYQFATVSVPASHVLPRSRSRGEAPWAIELGVAQVPALSPSVSVACCPQPQQPAWVFLWPRTRGTLLSRAYGRQSARSLPLMGGRQTRAADEGNASGSPVRADSNDEDRSASISAYDVWRVR